MTSRSFGSPTSSTRELPPDPAPALDAYARKFGGPDAALRITDHLADMGRAEGLDLDFTIAQRANTLDAHRLRPRTRECTCSWPSWPPADEPTGGRCDRGLGVVSPVRRWRGRPWTSARSTRPNAGN